MKKFRKRIRRAVAALLAGLGLLALGKSGIPERFFRKQAEEPTVQVQPPGRDSYRFYLRPEETTPAETEPEPSIWSISG